jgi:hypothetical protein
MLTEIQAYLNLINDLRGQVGKLVADLPGDALSWRPVEGEGDHATNSLAVMAAHAAGGEHFWIGEVIGGLPSTRNREAEFATAVESAAPLLAWLEEVGAETRRLMPTFTAEQLERIYTHNNYDFTGRWAILHVIEHTSLHLGHMQITYQLWNSGKGAGSPRWFERPGRL